MNIFETDDNSTPLSEEEKQGLKARWITNRAELNEMETAGIAQAEIWLIHRSQFSGSDGLFPDSLLRDHLLFHGG